MGTSAITNVEEGVLQAGSGEAGGRVEGGMASLI